jgi:hypothetical protein
MTDDPTPRLTPDALTKLAAADGQLVVIAVATPIDNVDGEPLCVDYVPTDPPALLVVAWGHAGLPTRSEVYGDDD